MTENRIPTELWVSGVMRQCTSRSIPAYVIHKGAAAAGTVLVKVVLGGGQCHLQSQARDIDSRLIWMDCFDDTRVEESRADDYISRQRTRDPDIWVIEIEDKSGANPFKA